MDSQYLGGLPRHIEVFKIAAVDNDYRLSNDDTMKRLKVIAQSPGELQWRLELLSTLERMRIQQEVSTKGLFQELRLVKKGQIGRTELAEIINAQIREKGQAESKQVDWMWSTGVWLLKAAALGGFSLVGALIGIKGLK